MKEQKPKRRTRRDVHLAAGRSRRSGSACGGEGRATRNVNRATCWACLTRLAYIEAVIG